MRPFVPLVRAVDVEVAQADHLRTAGRQRAAHHLIGEQLGIAVDVERPLVLGASRNTWLPPYTAADDA